MPGVYFEDLTVGRVFEHGLRRTVTETDNLLVTTLTMNPAALHLDEQYCRDQTEWGQRIVNSVFTLGLVVGISVHDTTLGTTVANLGWDDVRFPRPVFHGDTIHVRSEVLSQRESRSRPDNGVVVFEHVGYNQRDEVVMSCKRTALMMKRPPGVAPR
ncbi:MAG TPA: MaoC family dehydratase [Burkholderiaceae bacterium]|nr:MaoC family dehydratase [Burkholderiaceae bacterium]